MENGIERPDESSVGCVEAMERYQALLDDNSQRQAALRQKDRWFGTVRLILFLAFLSLFAISSLWNDLPVASWLAWGSLIAFLIVVTLNEPLRDELGQLQKKVSVIKRLKARLNRDWEYLGSKRIDRIIEELDLPPVQRAVASDLDLLGKASLFSLVSMAFTEPGIRTLGRWLCGPSESQEASERAVAAATLAPLREKRLRFYTLSRQVSESSGSPDQFVRWAQGDFWLVHRIWLAHWSRLSTALSVTGIACLAAGLAGWSAPLVMKLAFIGLGILVVVNLVITTLMLGPAHAVFSVAMSNRRAVRDYQEIYASAELLGPTEANQGLLFRLKQVLIDEELSACRGMADLQKLARAGGLRQSAGTFLIYLPLQCLTLWDIRVLARLERWKETYGQRVGDWFKALGELEALMSIAAMRDDYPSWGEPTWVEATEGQQVSGTEIGHPLLSDQDRVCNDVTLGPQGSVLLVTGSNMSGKSTMMRSVGLNVSLAGIGAPVCAQSFELPTVELVTSIRVSDDVSQGVSFYMAELQRLKSVVDHARELSKKDDRLCIFLLDEILQGTNSRERQIAVVQVLQHLMNFGAIGAISTHDLELADEPDLMSVAEVVHFRETIRPDAEGKERMTFDYQMRKGVSPTTNALRLLQMVGLGQELNDQDTGNQE
ncbi:MAG: MutS family DNA mismatch repair protein [Planctomycetota bacterium]|nr:MutS family DNA mismatch repair protein [Planctomycetota bacterium]